MSVFKTFVLIALASIGCNTLDYSKVSGWESLNKSADLECQQVKVPDSVLKIQDLKIASGRHLYADVLDRRGRSVAVWGTYDGTSRFDLVNKLPFDLGLRPIGSGFKDSRFTIVAMNEKNQFTDYIISDSSLKKVKGGFIKQAVSRAYLTDRSNYFVGVEDKGDELEYFMISNANQSLKLSLPSDEVRLIESKDQDYIVIVQGKTLVIRGVSDPKLSKTIEFKDDISHVESQSWQGGLVLAVVYGDALSDTQPTLVVQSLNVDQYFKQQWVLEENLDDINISNLKLYPCKNDLCLMMNQWIDSQTTIANYVIDDRGKVKDQRMFGKLEKPQFINDVYYNEDQEKRFIVLREKAKPFWKFSLCQI